MKILLVEDEALLAEVLSEALAEAGYEPLVVYAGKPAIDELERASNAFSAVLTDIRMPGTLNGWDVSRKARELNPSVPVLYMSGDSSGDWKSKGVPNSLMLKKPFTLDEVVAALAQLLGGASPAGSTP